MTGGRGRARLEAVLALERREWVDAWLRREEGGLREVALEVVGWRGGWVTKGSWGPRVEGMAAERGRWFGRGLEAVLVLLRM